MTIIEALTLTVKLLLACAVVAACIGLVQFALNVWSDHELRRAASERARRENEMVRAELGALPVAYSSVLSGETLGAAVSLLAANMSNQRPVQPVPHSISYAPHLINKNDVEVQPAASPVATLPAPSDFWSLYSGGRLPKDRFLLGYSLDDNEAVTATWRDLYSALVGGQSGSGKSTLIRCILAQSAMQGGRFVCLDKHYEAGEESLGASLMPLRTRLATEIAANETQMVDALRYVRSVAAARLAGQDGNREPLILVVDETTALLQRSGLAGELIEVLGMIAQESRKVAVYAFCIGQQWTSQVMSTTVRNSFVSAISCRARRDVARIMSGSTAFGQLAESLTIGQAVWQAPSGEVIRLAVPNTTQGHLGMVANLLETHSNKAPQALQVVEPGRSPGLAPGRTPARPDDDATLDLTLDSGRAALVKQMFVAGAGRSEIIRDVWKIEARQGGNAFKTATRELDEILRTLIR